MVEPTRFAQLSKRLEPVETGRAAAAFEQLSKQHALIGADRRINESLFDDAETALADLTDYADDLVALRGDTLAEVKSKREMRDMALEVERITNAFHSLQSSVNEERAKLDDPAVYRGALRETEAALGELTDNLDGACADIRNRT